MALLHTSEDKWQAAALAVIGRCFMCSAQDHVVDLPEAMSPEFKACPKCVEKFGAKKLTKESDELLASLSTPEARRQFMQGLTTEVNTKCIRCGAPQMTDAAGMVKTFCSDCWGGIVASLRVK